MTIKDADLEIAFIDRLSATSKHYRFLGGIHYLSEIMIEKFCDVDFDKNAAFIATTVENEKSLEIGVVRYVEGSANDEREMAITVADKWQHKGLGTILAQQLIEFAKSKGIKKLYSIDLADNIHMQKLAKDLNMTSCEDPNDAHQVIYSITL